MKRAISPSINIDPPISPPIRLPTALKCPRDTSEPKSLNANRGSGLPSMRARIAS
ncbi:hypothetical protein D3C87_1344040 [compost metagenome]